MARGREGGAWLMALAAAIGLIVSLIAYFHLGSGIDHTAGALLVIISTVLLTGAGVVLALTAGASGGWRTVLNVLCILDVVGTGVAAWFLHAWLLLALMAAALIGWLVSIVSRPAGSTGAPRSARAVP
jgi:hypothetical protein